MLFTHSKSLAGINKTRNKGYKKTDTVDFFSSISQLNNC